MARGASSRSTSTRNRPSTAGSDLLFATHSGVVERHDDTIGLPLIEPARNRNRAPRDEKRRTKRLVSPARTRTAGILDHAGGPCTHGLRGLEMISVMPPSRQDRQQIFVLGAGSAQPRRAGTVRFLMLPNVF